MITKLLSLFLLLITFLNAKEYPQTYSQLGTPLYRSLDTFEDCAKYGVLESEIALYKQLLLATEKEGLVADTSQERKVRKEYLKSLRKLQKEYDRLLSLLQSNIIKSIETDEYLLFLQLINYNFEGLFQSSAFKNRILSYYKNNSAIKKSKILENEIQHIQLREETVKFFEAEIVKSSYNSNSKNRTTKKVTIETSRVENEIKVMFINRNIYPVTVKIKPVYKNVAPLNHAKSEIVIKAKSRVAYVTLRVEEGDSYYGYSFSWVMGSKYAKHDDNYLYALPYKKGTFHMVSQGYNGSKTHTGTSAYAIDFPMKIGTAIVASRDGVVVKTKSNSNRGGYDKKFASSGNYVRILHSDGTFATYYHLKQNGVSVKVGQKVSKGELIGYSGNTGYTSGPHLHFAVFKAISASTVMTLPVKIVTKRGIITKPVIGNYYKAK